MNAGRSRRLAAFVGSGVVRLGSLLTAVFLVANLAAFIAAYLLSMHEMDNRLRAELRDEFADLETLASTEGPDALEQELLGRAEAASPGHQLYILWSKDGVAPPSGNARLPAPFVGWRTFGEDEIAISPPEAAEDNYLALGASLAGRALVLARDTGARGEVVEIFSQSLLVGLAASAVLAIAGTAWFLTRAEARITAIGRTLAAVADGNLDRRVPAASDSDDLGRIAIAINAMLDRLSDNIASLRQVSADIAHDLRTPLTRLRATLDQIGAGSATDIEAVADDARAQIDAIDASFQALLRIAQIEGGSPRARFRPVDLAELCMTVADLFQPAAEDQGRAFLVAVPASGTLMVEGDRDLLAQMLSNLLENALRHAPPPAGIALRLKRRGDAAEVTVADEGPGVPSAERHKVFRRLYRLEASRTTEGSGLGLSLVAAIVALHGGSVRLEENAPGLRAIAALPLMRSRT